MPDPMTSEQVQVNTSSAVGFTTGNFAIASGGAVVGRGQQCQQVLVTLETNDARYHVSGKTPATACGHVWVAGDSLVINGLDAIAKFKVCNTNAATSTFVATFFF